MNRFSTNMVKINIEKMDGSMAPWARASEARIIASSARPHMPTPTVRASRADIPMRSAMLPALVI